MPARFMGVFDCIKDFSETDSMLKVHPGLPHGACTINKDQIGADLFAFIKT